MTSIDKPWGESDLMAVCAVEYCLGRRTYITGMCANWLTRIYKELDRRAKDLIMLRVEEAFDRYSRGEPRALGDQCDRKEWERVRKLWEKS